MSLERSKRSYQQPPTIASSSTILTGLRDRAELVFDGGNDGALPNTVFARGVRSGSFKAVAEMLPVSSSSVTCLLARPLFPACTLSYRLLLPVSVPRRLRPSRRPSHDL